MDLTKKKSKPNVSRPKVSTVTTDNGTESTVQNGDNTSEHFGISDEDTFIKLISGLVGFYRNDPGNVSIDAGVNCSLEVLSEIRPNDLLEYQLITQMIMTHQMFEKCSLRANIKDQDQDRVEQYVKSMSKLSRLYINQLKALTRYRNNGQQKVKVEHVHISDGGRAVFGDIKTAQVIKNEADRKE
jgi:hypothetical protein